jgi:O-antigen ligase
MVTAIIVSALTNGSTGVIESLAKWGYLIVLTLTAYEAFQRHGSVAILIALLTVFLSPLALQMLSVFTNLGKGSDISGEVCYIGGYSHESAFSVIVLTFLCCACFLERERLKLSTTCIMIAIGALLLANYRTSILAALPMLGATFYIGTVRRFSPPDRSIVMILLALSAASLLYVTGIVMQDRFVDLFTILSNGADLIKPPEFYTEADADILSGRVAIWSNYITAYINGSVTNLVFGFGPDAWEGIFPMYAHNTFVSALYEVGIFGLLSMVLLFASSFKRAMNSPRSSRYVIVGAHFGFFVLNLATMPLWMIEGNILLALVLAYTLHMRVPRQVRLLSAASGVSKVAS